MSTIVGDDKQLRFSLGTLLALNYLQEQEIQLQPIDRNRNSLGQAVFKRFESNDGGYVQADSGGYQVLLNFWGTRDNFEQYSLTQVLNGKTKAENIRDRLILIGVTAESLKDSFYTPYSKGWFDSPQKMPGVFIHANVTSQIVNAAINNRPLLHTYNKSIEFLWILFWGIVGAIIIWRLNQKIIIFVSIIMANLVTISFCYLAFILGCWLPLFPSLLTLNTTAAAVLFANNRKYQQVKFQYILDRLSQEPNAIVQKIALEYYKQSENRQNQAAIKEIEQYKKN